MKPSHLRFSSIRLWSALPNALRNINIARILIAQIDVREKLSVLRKYKCKTLRFRLFSVQTFGYISINRFSLRLLDFEVFAD